MSAGEHESMCKTRGAGACAWLGLVELCTSREPEGQALHQSSLQIAFIVACHVVPMLMVMREVQV